DVGARQLFDSFPETFLELHRDAEGERRQDGELMRGVDALDVEARIGLRVPAPLRLAEGGREIDAAVAHLGKNEVGRAVDVAADQLDDDVDLRVAYQLERIADDFGLFPSNLLGPVKGFVGDLRDLDRAAGAALDLVGVAAEHVPRAAPHRADAQQPYINRLHFVSGGIEGD